MKFEATLFIWAALLVIMSLSAVNALPVEGQVKPESIEAVDPTAADFETRGDGKFRLPEDVKVDTNNGGKKLTGCGFRSFFTYHSCL
ncbi:hypothetical protein BGX28_009398 [Mortierella sp. GBA30]|nr:hypothetical protein BGX28_009398 [Mortierella sp. GBA30]